MSETDEALVLGWSSAGKGAKGGFFSLCRHAILDQDLYWYGLWMCDGVRAAEKIVVLVHS